MSDVPIIGGEDAVSPETFKSTPKTHPLVAMMPAHLKDPANYDKIQRTIISALASTHSHGEVIEWAACASCQRRFSERSHILKQLGFSSPAQYMVWKRVHETIRQRVPFAKYNTK